MTDTLFIVQSADRLLESLIERAFIYLKEVCQHVLLKCIMNIKPQGLNR